MPKGHEFSAFIKQPILEGCMRLEYAVIISFFLFSPAYADIFLDNDTAGCVSGATNYAPSTRSCGSGSDTVYTTPSNANSGVAAGSMVSPTMINIRSGTDYTQYFNITKNWTTWQKYPSDSADPVFDPNNPNWSTVGNTSGQWAGMINVQASNVVINGLTMEHIGFFPSSPCDKWDPIGYAIQLDGDGFDGLEVKNCTFNYIGGAGIDIRFGDDFSIHDNIFHENEYIKLECQINGNWGAAIQMRSNANGGEVYNNYIHGVGGECINYNRGGNDITIRDNVIVDCLRPSLYIAGVTDAYVHGNLVYHTGDERYGGNFSSSNAFVTGITVGSESYAGTNYDVSDVYLYDNVVVGTEIGMGIILIQAGNTVSNTYWGNNTVLECPGQAFYVSTAAGLGRGNVAENNIFWRDAKGSLAGGDVTPSGWTFRTNLWAGGNSPPANFQSSTDPTYPSYPALSQQDYFVKHDGWDSLTHRNLKLSDLNLLGSAINAIDQGTPNAYHTAFGSSYDCGALEYNSDRVPKAPRELTLQ